MRLFNWFKKKKRSQEWTGDLVPKGIKITICPDAYKDNNGNPWSKPKEPWYNNQKQ